MLLSFALCVLSCYKLLVCKHPDSFSQQTPHSNEKKHSKAININKDHCVDRPLRCKKTERAAGCNEPQKLNKKLLGFVICIKNIQLKNGYKPYKNA